MAYTEQVAEILDAILPVIKSRFPAATEEVQLCCAVVLEQIAADESGEESLARIVDQMFLDFGDVITDENVKKAIRLMKVVD